MQQGEIMQGASAVVFDRQSVLLVKRAKAPAAGFWSFPGGHICAGEDAQAAALREVLEETGLDVEIAGSLGQRDVESRGGDGERRVYRLSVFVGVVPPGSEPRAASDAADAKFVPLGELGRYRLTSGAEDTIRSAWLVLHGASAQKSGDVVNGRGK